MPSKIIQPPRHAVMQLTFDVPEGVTDVEFTGVVLNGVTVAMSIASFLRTNGLNILPGKAPTPQEIAQAIGAAIKH